MKAQTASSTINVSALIKRFRQQKGLSLDALLTLCELADAGTFAKLSPGNRNRQSTCSRQIGSLESFLECGKLTTRKGNEVLLNSLGRQLAAEIGQLFRNIQDAVDSSEANTAHVRVGGNGAVLEFFVIPKLAKIVAKRPNLRFDLFSMRTDEVADALRSDKIDLGFLSDNQLMGKAFNSREAVNYGFKLYSANSDKLATALLQPMALPRRRRFRSALEAEFQRHAFAPRVVFECDSFAQCFRLVEAGSASSVLPDIAGHLLRGCKAYSPQWLKSMKVRTLLSWSKKRDTFKSAKLIREICDELC